jgi:hypothetical protein
MFSNWFSKKSEEKVGFEDILYATKHRDTCILLNTLPPSEQMCLISGTLLMETEEKVINKLLQNNHHNQIIIIYGKNNCDTKVEEKYTQLAALGFTQVYMYHGGLFEWLLLQDIYGQEFTTTSEIRDLLHYRPQSILHH